MTKVICVFGMVASCIGFVAQDRLRQNPLYEKYTKMRVEYGSAIKRNDLTGIVWDPNGKFVFYRLNGTGLRFEFDKKSAQPGEAPVVPPTTNNGTRFSGSPDRGRQFTEATSPNGKWKAVYKDRNLFLIDTANNNTKSITTDGNALTRIKNGNASWVYGEELGVREAFWFSPDSKTIAYYRFDESKVKDYFLTPNSVPIQNELDVEAYPKAGSPNPAVDLYLFDIEKSTTQKIDVRNGRQFDEEIGHYVYSVRWSPSGEELFFNRTNRKQNEMEFCAADKTTGSVRVVIRESWPNSWVENSPEIRYLSDNNRFIWVSERTGFRNYYLYDVSGKLIATLTNNKSDCVQISRVTKDEKTLFYTCRDGDNPYLIQLHRVGMDGKGDAKLTDVSLAHTVNVSPDGKWFVDTAENHLTPPRVSLKNQKGELIAQLSEADVSKFKSLGLQSVELIAFPAADGKTTLYGLFHKPIDFNPYKKYPLLVDVYGGPESGTVSERFSTPNSLTEMGFLIAEFDGRGTNGRGKAFKDEVYQKLGIVEIDDQAAGVEYLKKRPYVDGNRVGIFGTSYGGYASAMAILRHPKTFTAAVACSSVTDWRNYDTIYTERYMWTPQENKAGYDAGSCMTYAGSLTGRLLLYYGTADNNVHPSNTFQLVRALQRSGKSYDMQIGPDQGHSGVNMDTLLQYFAETFGLLIPGN